MVKHTREEQCQLIEKCQASGKTAKAWCHENGIAYSTFMGWIRISAEEGRAVRAEVASESVIVPPPPAGGPEAAVKWAVIKPRLYPTEPKAELLSGTPDPVPQARDTRSSIQLLFDGFTINVETGFDAGLLTDVLRVVNRVCC